MLHGHHRADRAAMCAVAHHLPTVHLDEKARGLVERAGEQCHFADRCDAGEGFPPEAERCDPVQITDVVQLAGCMAREGQWHFA